jgi:uncharacterized protein YfaS (alpha-2-macroglobulin family)
VQSLAAIPLKAPLRAGYAVTRTLSAVEQKDKATWSRGDVVKVRLEIDAQSDMTWVVVSDPVPGGATILGGGLGRDSQIATRGEQRSGTAWPAYEERGFEAFRAYYEYLPRGKHVVEYTVRLNNPGRFALPPSRVEAMYAPESFASRRIRASRSRRDATGRARSVPRAGVAGARALRDLHDRPGAAVVRRGQGGASPVRPHPRRSPRHADPDRFASTRRCGA